MGGDNSTMMDLEILILVSLTQKINKPQTNKNSSLKALKYSKGAAETSGVQKLSMAA